LALYVHRSNRTERLLDLLAELVSTPLPSPFDPEVVVVQGRGMERWLAMQLANKLGVWANPSFHFPKRFVQRILDSVLGAEPDPLNPFEPEILTWSIADLLPHLVSKPGFEPIKRYLDGHEPGSRRALQLATRVADRFDDYAVFRPHMVLDWETGAEPRGGDELWQAELWRALVERHGPRHVAARSKACREALERGEEPQVALPERVFLFGVSTLAPLHVQLLNAVSPWLELHLFVPTPSREYWGEIRSRRDILREEVSRRTDADSLHLIEGHPLLASLGRVGRDFQQVLQRFADRAEEGLDLYQDPGQATALVTLQSDILALLQRASDSVAISKLVLDPDDSSVAVHACHSPMREVEVLHDQLVALFDRDPTLEPPDVVVMSPDIDTYAPLVDAVFSGRVAGRSSIPHRISDRAVRATHDVVDAFARMLNLVNSRLTASSLVDLLGIKAVRARFGMSPDDLTQVKRWIDESGIRWAADAEHRRALDQPGFIENTWRFGLERLFLGVAMTGDDRTLFANTLPYDDIEGTGALLLGQLAEFVRAVFNAHKKLETPRPLVRWCDDLLQALESLVQSDPDNEYQHHMIRSALDELGRCASVAGHEQAVALGAVRTQLDQALARAMPAHGFLSGGVTFCALVPMRSIPFRVVCLLGMSDERFPRITRPTGFDLMAAARQPGDRSSRDDDRYLFLEAILAARERLLITYVGQSIQDNSEIPPSVVVSDLLDAVAETYARHDPEHAEETDRAVRDHLVARHPLQPFSPDYFGASEDPRLFSYRQDHCRGARALCGPRREAAPFFDQPLAPDPDPPEAVDLDELTRFFHDPIRALLRRRLGISLGADVAPVIDREPIELGGLERWQVGDPLLQRLAEGGTLETAYEAMRASGALPLGTTGRCVFDEVAATVHEVATHLVPAIEGLRHEPLQVDVEIDGSHIVGQLDALWPGGQVHHTFSRLGAKTELVPWIRHLFLCLLEPRGVEHVTRVFGRPEKKRKGTAIQFEPVEQAEREIETLVRIYRRGLLVPLPLFKRASWAYVETLRRGGDGAEEKALKKARKKYHGDERYDRPDANDPYVRQVFGGRDPLQPAQQEEDDFRTLARAVYDPLLAHRRPGP